MLYLVYHVILIPYNSNVASNHTLKHAKKYCSSEQSDYPRQRCLSCKTKKETSRKITKVFKKESANNSSEEEKTPLKRFP